jgi:hypothetical protein
MGSCISLYRKKNRQPHHTLSEETNLLLVVIIVACWKGRLRASTISISQLVEFNTLAEAALSMAVSVSRHGSFSAWDWKN